MNATTTALLDQVDYAIVEAAGLAELFKTHPKRALHLALNSEEHDMETELAGIATATADEGDKIQELIKDLDFETAGESKSDKPQVKCEHCDVTGSVPGVKRHTKAKHS